MTEITALLVALIAGIFSVVGLVISKEQKVSEFRQAWIDGLRQDIANLMANAAQLHAEIKLTKRKQEKSQESAFADYLERAGHISIAFNKSSSLIKLRLNRKEEDSDKLWKMVDNVERLLEKLNIKADGTYDEIEPEIKKIEHLSREVLKTEWDRVKKGEEIYQNILRSSIAVGLIAFVTVVLISIVKIFFC